MTKTIVAAALGLLVLAPAAPASAATSIATWEDPTYEKTGSYGTPILVDDALGSWCHLKTTDKNVNRVKVMLFERVQKCRTPSSSAG